MWRRFVGASAIVASTSKVATALRRWVPLDDERGIFLGKEKIPCFAEYLNKIKKNDLVTSDIISENIKFLKLNEKYKH